MPFIKALIELLPLLIELVYVFMSLGPDEREGFKKEAKEAMDEARSTGNTRRIGEFLRGTTKKG